MIESARAMSVDALPELPKSASESLARFLDARPGAGVVLNFAKTALDTKPNDPERQLLYRFVVVALLQDAGASLTELPDSWLADPQAMQFFRREFEPEENAADSLLFMMSGFIGGAGLSKDIEDPLVATTIHAAMRFPMFARHVLKGR